MCLTGKVPEWSWPRTSSGCYGSCHSPLGPLLSRGRSFIPDEWLDGSDNIWWNFSLQEHVHVAFMFFFSLIEAFFTRCAIRQILCDNGGFPVCDVKHIWWDYLIVNSWYLQMNNRLCPLRTVPLCLPSLWKEFQIISGQRVSSRLFYCKVLFKTGCWSILLPWRRTHHISS